MQHIQDVQCITFHHRKCLVDDLVYVWLGVEDLSMYYVLRYDRNISSQEERLKKVPCGFVILTNYFTGIAYVWL